MSQSISFRLSISQEQYLAYYQGVVTDVIVRSEDNRTLRFPASAIKKYLTHDGIFGRFEIHFDANNKLIRIDKV